MVLLIPWYHEYHYHLLVPQLQLILLLYKILTGNRSLPELSLSLINVSQPQTPLPSMQVASPAMEFAAFASMMPIFLFAKRCVSFISVWLIRAFPKHDGSILSNVRIHTRIKQTYTLEHLTKLKVCWRDVKVHFGTGFTQLHSRNIFAGTPL